VANKQDYLDRLKATIQQLHNCGAVWFESVPVTEIFQGKTLWKGEVEVFILSGHPKTKCCYGWSHPEGDDNKGEQFVTVLEIPPVNSPETAVKISIVADIKKKEKSL
jgi:hypothetical protein